VTTPADDRRGETVRDSSEDLSRLSEDDRRLVQFSRRFDLRNIIGLVLLVYGVICVVMGLANGSADRQQAAGVPINLWTGVPLVVLGLLFFLWNRVSPRPVGDLVHDEESEEREGTGGF
jgi:drug/metabolite transporter (DMT)-like permease